MSTIAVFHRTASNASMGESGPRSTPLRQARRMPPAVRRGTVAAATLAGVIGLLAPSTAAQTEPATAISPDGAIALALQNNLSLKSARLEPEIADLGVTVAQTAWTPTLSARLADARSDTPVATPFDRALGTLRNTQVTSDIGLSQVLPWGASYRAGWSGARRDTNSATSLFQPQLAAGVNATLVQPLLKGLRFDDARAGRETSLRTRDIAGARLQMAVASLTRQVSYAYWTWAYTYALLDVEQQALTLAQRLLDGNRRRVATGAMAAVDVIEAEAEVARRGEAIIIASKDVANAEDRLRALIFEPENPRYADRLSPTVPITAMTNGPVTVTVSQALSTRLELQTLRSTAAIERIDERRFRNSALPDASVQMDYSLQASGGTEILRADGLIGPVVGTVDRSFGTVIGDLARVRYPSWSVQLSLSYPLGTAVAEANAARASVRTRQAEASLAAAEQVVATEVRAALREVDANQRRLESTATAVGLWERRLDAEERKFAVGLSTSFFVFQAQRDLTSAREAQLRSMLDYRLSVADASAVPFIPVTP